MCCLGNEPASDGLVATNRFYINCQLSSTLEWVYKNGVELGHDGDALQHRLMTSISRPVLRSVLASTDLRGRCGRRPHIHGRNRGCADQFEVVVDLQG
jgi:hypothetical protein